MHFFYIDESGCTGADLENTQQPIFVIGGLSVKDVGWRQTVDEYRDRMKLAFPDGVPDDFELHSHELLNQQGHFEHFSREEAGTLATDLIQIVVNRGHPIHYVAIDKSRLRNAFNDNQHPAIDPKVPYQLGFNYLLNYINRYSKEKIGSSARSMVILDEKDLYQPVIDKLIEYRRYEVAQARRLKQIVEFSYPIDSRRHPMIQLSDLIIFCVRKFLELEGGYRENWPPPAKDFYARTFLKISSRVTWKKQIDIAGPEERSAAALLTSCFASPRGNWRRGYAIE